MHMIASNFQVVTFDSNIPGTTPLNENNKKPLNDFIVFFLQTSGAF